MVSHGGTRSSSWGFRARRGHQPARERGGDDAEEHGAERHTASEVFCRQAQRDAAAKPQNEELAGVSKTA